MEEIARFSFPRDHQPMDVGPYPDIRFESSCEVVPVIAFGWTPHRTQLSHVPFRTVTVQQLP